MSDESDKIVIVSENDVPQFVGDGNAQDARGAPSVHSFRESGRRKNLLAGFPEIFPHKCDDVFKACDIFRIGRHERFVRLEDCAVVGRGRLLRFHFRVHKSLGDGVRFVLRHKRKQFGKAEVDDNVADAPGGVLDVNFASDFTKFCRCPRDESEDGAVDTDTFLQVDNQRASARSGSNFEKVAKGSASRISGAATNNDKKRVSAGCNGIGCRIRIHG